MSTSKTNYSPDDKAPDSAQARRFLRRFLWFLSPFVLVIGILEAILWSYGDNWPLEQVVKAQSTQPDLIWQRGFFSQDIFRYKFLNWQKRRPQILVLGSSRVMHFRTPMFGNSKQRTLSFYNAGGMTRSVDDLALFANLLNAQNKPQVLIIGVDIWTLNDRYAHPLRFERDIYVDGVRDWRAHAQALRSLLNSPRSLLPLAANSPALTGKQSIGIGWGARFQTAGTRSDGSQIFGKPLPVNTTQHPGGSATAKSIQKGLPSFLFSEGINEDRLERFKNTLLLLKRHGVLVLGFAPPLATREAQLMATHPRQQLLWKEYRTQVPALFDDLGFPFCDASQPSQLGLDDRYMWDATHAGETFHLYVLRHWLRDARVRQAFPEASQTINFALNSPRTTPSLVAYPESN